MFKKVGVLFIVLALSACAVSKDERQREHDQVAALKAVNKADRHVLRCELAVKVSTSALIASNAALVAAKQNQRKTRADFEALYLASQPGGK